MRESQFIYDLRTRLNNTLYSYERASFMTIITCDYIKLFIADINAMWHAKRKLSSMEIMEIPMGGEKERERIRNRAEISPSMAIFETHLARVCPSLFYTSVQRARGHVCMLLDPVQHGSDLESDDFKWPSVWAAARYFSSASRTRSPENGDRRAGTTIFSRSGPRAWCSCASSISIKTWTSRKRHVTCTKVRV